jgi:hypothetical protein
MVSTGEAETSFTLASSSIRTMSGCFSIRLRGSVAPSLPAQAIEGVIKDCGAALVVIITCDSLTFGEDKADPGPVLLARRDIRFRRQALQ